MCGRGGAFGGTDPLKARTYGVGHAGTQWRCAGGGGGPDTRLLALCFCTTVCPRIPPPLSLPQGASAGARPPALCGPTPGAAPSLPSIQRLWYPHPPPPPPQIRSRGSAQATPQQRQHRTQRRGQVTCTTAPRWHEGCRRLSADPPPHPEKKSQQKLLLLSRLCRASWGCGTAHSNAPEFLRYAPSCLVPPQDQRVGVRSQNRSGVCVVVLCLVARRWPEVKVGLSWSTELGLCRCAGSVHSHVYVRVHWINVMWTTGYRPLLGGHAEPMPHPDTPLAPGRETGSQWQSALYPMPLSNTRPAHHQNSVGACCVPYHRPLSSTRPRHHQNSVGACCVPYRRPLSNTRPPPEVSRNVLHPACGSVGGCSI